MRVINSTARTTVLRELALLRALCVSLRNRRPAKRAAKLLAKSVQSPPPARLPAETTDLVLGGPP